MIFIYLIVLSVGGHQREIDLAETTDRPVILETRENLLVVHQDVLVAGVKKKKNLFSLCLSTFIHQERG